MRIALMSWESLHSVGVGGVGVHVTELAAGLQRLGHEVHVFVRIGQGQREYDCIDGVHYHRCGMDLNPDFVQEMNNMCCSFAWRLGEVESGLGGHFDIIHCHDWLTEKALVQIKNNMHRKTVFTLHSTEYGRCGNNSYSGQSARISSIEAEGSYVADRVITVSGVLADEVKRVYNVPDWKLRMIYNGINVHRYDGYIDPGICRRTYGIGPMDPMVLFVGRLSIQKGPDLLLEAVPEILSFRGDAKIVFAGDGYMRRQLEDRARQLNVMHACRFLGSMSPDGDLINLFKSTDCVCVPSRNEPFGIVVLEAWAAGKPVVATVNGGPREFVTHNKNGYLIYDHKESIAWGVKEVFRNFAHAKWMGEQGRVTAAYGFSWDTIAKQTEGVYGELL